MNAFIAPTDASSRLLFVFDVGGVLIELDRHAREEQLNIPTSLPDSVATQLSQANRQFRLGHIPEQEYVQRMCELHAVSAETFYEAESAFLVAGDPAMMKLVADLNKFHRTVVFSNTHAIHWRRVERDLIACDAFHAFYLSHELGLEKPDLISFDAVAKREGYPVEKIVFVDDTLMNVDAARSAGWGHCIHHQSYAETIAAIASILT